MNYLAHIFKSITSVWLPIFQNDTFIKLISIEYLVVFSLLSIMFQLNKTNLKPFIKSDIKNVFMCNKHMHMIMDRFQTGVYFIVNENLLHSITGKTRKGWGSGLSFISLDMASSIKRNALTSFQFMSFTEILKSPLNESRIFVNINKQNNYGSNILPAEKRD